MSPTLDGRQGRLDLLADPDLGLTATVPLPVGYPLGGPWTATIGEGDDQEPLAAPTLDGQDLQIPFTAADLAPFAGLGMVRYEVSRVGLPVIVGSLVFSDDGSASPSVTATVILNDQPVVVSLAGPPGPSTIVGEVAIHTLDSSSIDFDGDGTEADPLTAVVKPNSIGAAEASDELATQAGLEVEMAARAAADDAVAVVIAAETAARQAGDGGLDARLDVIEGLGPLATDAALAGEAAARLAGDNGLDARLDVVEALGPLATDAGLTAEEAARQAADLLLIPLAQKAAANGVATLGADAKIPVAQLPAVAISNFLGEVASQAAMLALVGERGDWALRSDEIAAKRSGTFILIGDDPTQLADWKQLPTVGDAVTSVNARAGGVIGLAEQAALQAEIDRATAAEAAKETPAGAQAKVDVETAARVAGDGGLDARLDVIEGTDFATQVELDAHITDAVAAHADTAVSFSDAGLVVITGVNTVHAALAAVDAALAARTFVWRGAWAAGINYVLGNIVSRPDGSWRALRANIGVVPVVGADWDLVAPAGVDADSTVGAGSVLAATVNCNNATHAALTDVAGLTYAPGTVNPVYIWAHGQLGFIAGAGLAANSNVIIALDIVDNLGNIRRSFSWSVVLGPSQNIIIEFMAKVPVVPPAADRTYKMRCMVPANITARFYGTDAPVGADGHFRMYGTSR